MGKYHTPLKVEQVSEATGTLPSVWQFLEPLIYESRKLGIVIVDRGKLTNFASVPRLPISYLLFGGRNNAPAALHDNLYDPEHDTGRGIKVTRLQADNLIFEATVDSFEFDAYSFKSISKKVMVYFLASVTWASVRLFGWHYWKV